MRRRTHVIVRPPRGRRALELENQAPRPPRPTPSERLRRRKARPKVSIVIPCYNEEPNVPTLVARLFPVLEQLGRSYEVIFVDDGSRDRTLELLKDTTRARPN